MKAYKLIEEVLNKKNYKILKENEWLRLLFLKETTDDINVENFEKISAITKHSTLNYVYQTLKILDAHALSYHDLTEKEYNLLEETLCWCEVAKCGSKKIRDEWEKKHFLLNIHNIGSSQIYEDYNRKKIPYRHYEYISTLIKTHGQIGQYLRGEVSLYNSAPLAFISYPDINHKKIVYVLNECIVSAVSPALYKKLKAELNHVIDKIFDMDFSKPYPFDRLKALRSNNIQKGEDFKLQYEETIKKNPDIEFYLFDFLNSYNLWYVESGLNCFHTSEVMKLFAYIAKNIDKEEITEISFANLMNLYCDRNGKKVINIFKQRWIEKLLKNFKLSDNVIGDERAKIHLDIQPPMVYVNFVFNDCTSSFLDIGNQYSGKDILFDKVMYMICEEVGITRDQYDRLYNEDSYLKTMDSTLEHKMVLLDYVKGSHIVDIGPAGGTLMDQLSNRYPTKKIMGVEISDNIIEQLTERKKRENRNWEVLKGNAFYLEEIFTPGEVDTFIFSSVIHELFSYPTLEKGKCFNYSAIEKTLKSAYHILPIGGRIIIRDGIMTNSQEKRIIKFKNSDDMKILYNYVKDFKGREIQFTELDSNAVLMPINDAMEFLYTYTWGKESYPHEVKEQFGYFTPNEYVNFVTKCFEGNLKIIKQSHFLQDGYEEHLLKKISFFDEHYHPTSLPDSTFILVVEKI